MLTLIHNTYPWLFPAAAAVLGAVFGSFVNCARSRLPYGKSLWHPPSQCDACHRTLTALDLIPIISYLLLRGKCRTCGAKIPLSTLWVEISYTISAALIVYLLGPAVGLPLLCLGIAASVPLVCRFFPL